jgi:hypothetical protein
MTSPDQRYQDGLAYAERFFMGQAEVQKAARKLEARLQELGIPYAIAGGLAVVAHGHLRVTTDVDVLLTEAGLACFKEQSLGRGWVEKFAGSRGVRDPEFQVPIDVLLAGRNPGDGEPRGLVFPDPATVAVDLPLGRFLSLPSLIELKIASGSWTRDRLQDLADVLKLIRANRLAPDFVDRLHPAVRDKYRELWDIAQHPSPEEP